MIQLDSLSVHRSYLTILLLVTFSLLSTHHTLRAQVSPCDSCATVKQLLGKWGKQAEASASFQLLDEDGAVLVENMQRVTRGTVRIGAHPRQALRLFHDDGGRCRDTIILIDRPFTLHRPSERGSERVNIPILPAREFLCESLRSPNSIYIGGGVGMLWGIDDEEHERDRILPTYRLNFGGTIGREVELALSAEFISTSRQAAIPFFLTLRWSPFGGKKVESALHYVPSACQFTGPDDDARQPPKSVCASVDGAVRSDHSVYVVEERWSVPVPFTPFVYAEAGLILNGDALVGRSLYGTHSVDDLKGGGVGATLIKPLVVALGYRHSTLSSHTLILWLGAEFW